MSSRLWSATTPGSNFDVTTGVQVGNRFTVSEAGHEVTHLSWHRHSVSGAGATRLFLWEFSTHAVLANVAAADSGAAGWQTTLLSAPVALDAAEEYVVSANFPNTAEVETGPAVPSPDGPLAFVEGRWQTPPADPPTWPENVVAGGYPVDAILDAEGSGGGGDGGATPEQVEAELAKWLSSDAATQEHEADGLPWKMHAEVTHGTHGLSVLGELLGDVLEDTAALLARVPSNLAATLTTIKDAVTIGPLPGIVGLQNLAETILSTLEAAAGFLSNPNAGPLGALTNNPPVPGAGWTLQANIGFTQCVSWDVPADLYVLTCEDFPPGRPAVDVCGAPWRPRLGWWCVRNGDFFGERRFIDFEKTHLQDGGRRMNGVLIWLEPNTVGLLEAWTLD